MSLGPLESTSTYRFRPLDASGGPQSARLRSRRSSLTLGAGVLIIIGLCLASLVGRWVLPDPNAVHLNSVLQAPSWAEPMGTDNVGRDVLSRTLAATWVDLSLAVGATLLSVAFGVAIGTVAGYFRGWIERIVMRIVDVVIAFPFMVIVLFIIAVVGAGLTGVFIALILADWAFYARLSRGEMLSLSERPFITAARMLGVSRWRLLSRHAVPNIIRPCLVYSMSDVVLNIMFIAALSYLGLGARPPSSEWGSIVYGGQAYILTAWWISVLPGCVVLLVGIGFSLIGDGLADRLREQRVNF